MLRGVSGGQKKRVTTGGIYKESLLMAKLKQLNLNLHY